MAENWVSKNSGLLAAIVVPLIVALLSPLITTGWSSILHKAPELVYSVGDGKLNLSEELTGGQPITIGGQKISSLVEYEVTIRNVGGSPLRDLPVKVDFFPNEATNFQFINVAHSTDPREEFGQIQEQTAGYSKRFVYSLLNPGDSDKITFLVSSSANIQLFSKAEGMKVTEERTSKESSSASRSMWVSGIALLIATLQGIVFEVMKRRKEQKKQGFKA